MVTEKARLSPTPLQVENVVRTLVSEGSGVPRKFVFSPNRPLPRPQNTVHSTVMPLEEMILGVPRRRSKVHPITGLFQQTTSSEVVCHYSVQWFPPINVRDYVQDRDEFNQVTLTPSVAGDITPTMLSDSPPGWSNAHYTTEASGRFELWVSSSEGRERARELGVHMVGTYKTNAEAMLWIDGVARSVYRFVIRFTRELYESYSDTPPIERADVAVHDPYMSPAAVPITAWEASPTPAYAHPVSVRGSDGLLYSSLPDGDLTVDPVALEWDSSTSYTHPALVRGSDMLLYRSKSMGTLSNDPVSNPSDWRIVYASNWSLIPEVWEKDKIPSYPEYTRTLDSNGIIYKAVVGGDLNEPPSRTNTDNWITVYTVNMI